MPSCCILQCGAKKDKNAPLITLHRLSSDNKEKRISQKLSCDHCSFQTRNKNTLILHIYNHYRNRRNQCQICSFKTKYPTTLALHIKIKHQTEISPEQKQMETYKCELCDYSSSSKQFVNTHLRQEHDMERIFQCPQCPYSTHKTYNFKKHAKVHRDGIFKCDKCPFVTKYEGHITRHLARIHNEVSGKAFLCDMCDFITKDDWRLNIHKQRSNQSTILKCDYCDHETTYMCEFRTHKSSHSVKDIIQKAPLTKKKSVTKYQLKQLKYEPVLTQLEVVASNEPLATIHKFVAVEHKQVMNDVKCDAIQNKQRLELGYCNRNTKNPTESNKEKQYLCNVCSFSSNFKPALKRHFQRHHTGSETLPYKCNNCDFSTKTQEQITLHNKRSKSDRELKCKTCDFISIYKCQNAMHQKTHHAFKCTVCTYSCRLKSELYKHSAIHTGNFLNCQYCDFITNRKDSLLYHETTHTGDKPYKCTLCPFTSVRKYLLDTHSKKYHGEVNRDIIIVRDDKIESLRVFEDASSKIKTHTNNNMNKDKIIVHLKIFEES